MQPTSCLQVIAEITDDRTHCVLGPATLMRGPTAQPKCEIATGCIQVRPTASADPSKPVASRDIKNKSGRLILVSVKPTATDVGRGFALAILRCSSRPHECGPVAHFLRAGRLSASLRA